MKRGKKPDVAPVSEGPAPDEPIEVAARRLVGGLSDRLRACERRLRAAKPDPEAVHDFRVTTRRLRAAIGLFEGALPSGPAGRAARRLRAAGRVAGEARDLEVMVTALERRAGAAGGGGRRGLGAVVERWRRRGAKARDGLVRYLDSSRHAALLERLERVAEPAAAPGAGKVRHAVAGILFRALGEARAALPGDAPALEDLHALRIRVKRLRYALEFLCDAAPCVRPLVPRLVELQDRLGAIEDARTAHRRIEDDLSTRSGRTIGVSARKALLDYLAALDGQPDDLTAASRSARDVLEDPEFRRAIGEAVAGL